VRAPKPSYRGHIPPQPVPAPATITDHAFAQHMLGLAQSLRDAAIIVALCALGGLALAEFFTPCATGALC
jgi:hypothetical protein